MMWRALAFSVSGLAAVAACSSNNSPTSTTCAGGETLVSGHCVAAQDSGALDHRGSNTSAPPRRPPSPKAGPPSPPPPAAAGSDDGDEGGPVPSDPCPSPLMVYLDCDPACSDAGGASLCRPATCGHGPMFLPQGWTSGVIRTPDAPGTDPSCASACPSGGAYAYGLGFAYADMGAGGTFLVTVAPPWEIVTETVPYCSEYDGGSAYVTTNCQWGNLYGTTVFYVMTKDPNAPARNITITLSSGSQSCPADGGI